MRSPARSDRKACSAAISRYAYFSACDVLRWARLHPVFGPRFVGVRAGGDLGFNYGQRHSIEMDVRLDVREKIHSTFPQWAERVGEDKVLSLDVLQQIGGSSLTDEVAFAMQAAGLPNTFVPCRNLLFLTVVGALAYRRGVQVIVTGVCETDFSGYPDCRDATMKAMQLALNLGL